MSNAADTVELSADQWEKHFWGSYCFGLGERTPADCNTAELLLVWAFCGHCSAPGFGGAPFILCGACFIDFGRDIMFNCVSCKMMDPNFLMAVGSASAEFVEAARKARMWAEYVPRKERRKANKASLVKCGRRSKSGGRHRGRR